MGDGVDLWMDVVCLVYESTFDCSGCVRSVRKFKLHCLTIALAICYKIGLLLLHAHSLAANTIDAPPVPPRSQCQTLPAL